MAATKTRNRSGSPRRVGFTVPDNDADVNAWLDAQEVMGLSIRQLIREQVKRHGAQDYFLTSLDDVTFDDSVQQPVAAQKVSSRGTAKVKPKVEPKAQALVEPAKVPVEPVEETELDDWADDLPSLGNQESSKAASDIKAQAGAPSAQELKARLQALVDNNE